MAKDRLSNRLDAGQCRQKAAEYRAMARQISLESHRVMVEHMAETWERIAKEFEDAE